MMLNTMLNMVVMVAKVVGHGGHGGGLVVVDGVGGGDDKDMLNVFNNVK